MKINKIYNVNHSRKGKFKLRIMSESEDWVTGFLVEGEPQMISKANPDPEIGESMTIRKKFCTFTEGE